MKKHFQYAVLLWLGLAVPGWAGLGDGRQPVTGATIQPARINMANPPVTTTPELTVISSGTKGTTQSSSGGVLFDVTNMTGYGLNIYSNGGAQPALAGILSINQANTGNDQPLIYLQGVGTSGGQAEIRMDSPNPDIEIIGTGSSCYAPYCRTEIAMANNADALQINHRMYDNSSFENVLRFGYWGSSVTTFLGQMPQKVNSVVISSGGLYASFDYTNTYYSGISFSSYTVANVTWTWPAVDGVNAQQIRTNGSGVLAWTGGAVSKTGAYTIPCSSGVVLSSANVSGGVTITVPSASGCGIGTPLSVVKVDNSTRPVIIVPTGADLLASATYFIMYSPQQRLSIISDGTNWHANGPLPHNAAFVGDIAEPGSAAAVATSSNTQYCPFEVDDPVSVTGVELDIGAGGTGVVDAGILNSNGLKLVSTGATGLGGTGLRTLTFTGSAYPLLPGYYYWALTVNNTVTTITRTGTGGSNLGCAVETGTSGTIPATANLTGTGAGVRQFAVKINTAGGDSL